jgi:3-methyl-2-oxobutanoate hydroxymethyltransferase
VGTSGQVLVWHDLLGINEGRTAKFVKRYANVAGEIRHGLETFAAEVRAGDYPGEEHTYPISDEEFALFESEVAPGVLVADDWL